MERNIDTGYKFDTDDGRVTGYKASVYRAARRVCIHACESTVTAKFNLTKKLSHSKKYYTAGIRKLLTFNRLNIYVNKYLKRKLNTSRVPNSLLIKRFQQN